ncbi:MAG: cytidine deaminase [Candidatus Ornithomonoglobus sp.]
MQMATDIIRKNYDSVNYWHTVGAAVRTKSGKIYLDANCDSVSHGSCAEFIAIGAAVTAGEREFDTIVAVLGGEHKKILPPCGNCRQMMYCYDKNINVIVNDTTRENILDLSKYPCD